jgi:nucleotide-binding universal stress UspA family protein
MWGALAMKKILVPVDFSPATNAVLGAVEALAIPGETRIVLVHVAPALSPALRDLKVPQQDRDSVAHALRDEHKHLQELAGRLTDRGYDAHALFVAGHRTVGKILDEAERLGADVIVLGSHGHGRVYDLLVGSTCEGVLRRAGVPVLIVPAVAPEDRGGVETSVTESARNE